METNEIIKIIEENEYKLLGEILVNEQEYSVLIDCVKDYISKLRNKAINAEKKIDLKFALGVTQTAIRSYDGNFWRRFGNKLGTELSNVEQRELGRIFLNTVRRYGLFEISNDTDRSQAAENIKAHTIVTNFNLPDWFDFWEAYYERYLFRNMKMFSDDDITAISEFMKQSMNKQNDIVIEDKPTGSGPSKTYQLPKATQRVLAECKSEAVRELIKITLEMIDNARLKGKMPDESFGRFENEFGKWFRKKQKSDLERYSKERESRIARSGRPYIEVDFYSGESKVIIPKQRFLKRKNNYIEYTIINGEDAVPIKRELILTRSEVWDTSRTAEEIIDDLFGKIEVKIDTKSSVFFHESDYRIFDSDFRSIKQLAKDADNIILLKKGTSFKAVNKGQKYVIDDSSDKWDIVSLYAAEDTELLINGKPLNIFGHFSDKPYFDSIVDKYSAKDPKGNSVVICKRHPTIYRMIDKQKCPGLILLVNDEKYEIGKKSFVQKDERSSEPNKYAVSVDLNKLLDDKTEVYDISWDIPGEGIRHICRYVFASRFGINADKFRYFCGEKAELRVDSDADVLCDLAAKTAENEYMIKMEIGEECTSVNFDLQLHESITFCYELPVVRWGFSKDDVCNISRYECIGNMSNPLYIHYPALLSFRDLKILLVVNKKCKKTIDAERTEIKDIFKADISEMLEIIEDLNIEKAYWAKIYISDGNDSKPVFLLKVVRWSYTVPLFNNWVLRIDENEKVYLPIDKIRGNGDIYLDIKTSNDKIPIVVEYKLHEGKNVLNGVYPNITYDIQCYTLEEDLFDSIRKDYRLIRRIGVTDTKDLTNAVFVIIRLYAGEEEIILGKNKYTVRLTDQLDEKRFTFELRKDSSRLLWDTALRIEKTDTRFAAEIESFDKELYYLKTDRSLCISTAPHLKRAIERNSNNAILLNDVKLRAELQIIQE